MRCCSHWSEKRWWLNGLTKGITFLCHTWTSEYVRGSIRPWYHSPGKRDVICKQTPKDSSGNDLSFSQNRPHPHPTTLFLLKSKKPLSITTSILWWLPPSTVLQSSRSFIQLSILLVRVLKLSLTYDSQDLTLIITSNHCWLLLK